MYYVMPCYGIHNKMSKYNGTFLKNVMIFLEMYSRKEQKILLFRFIIRSELNRQ